MIRYTRATVFILSAERFDRSSSPTYKKILTSTKSTPFLDWTHPEHCKSGSLKSRWQQQSRMAVSLFSNWSAERFDSTVFFDFSKMLIPNITT